MRSILLVKTSSLGDVIHNLPVVSDLRRIWPNIAIDWVVEEAFAEIPRLHPGVRTVLPMALRRWRKQLGQRATWAEMREFVRQLRTPYYDLILDTQGLIKSGIITRLARGLRCGYNAEVARERHAAWFYDCKYLIPPNAHAVERNRWLSAAACAYEQPAALRYGIHAPQATPGAVLQPAYCVLLSATSRDDKLWPEENWARLGQHLTAQGLRCVLPAGNPRERERATRIAASIPGATVAPPSSLNELATLLAGAVGVVGVDTGLTHLAAALDRPVVALYVATDPGLTGVFAGVQAVNLGGKGQIPSPELVLASLQSLLTKVHA
ncbi:lipopolysaccharide heptosyltransferase I [Uliginosibacterium flavum]|uniref:Lipopolysaccharide heptosyltransferase 1 n=1 Tax=Uliginosibacterium flavum TaxID=1396831 RepID=A0ABV2TJG0_9RHOO